MLDNNIAPLHPEHSSGLVYNMLIAQLLQLGNVYTLLCTTTHTRNTTYTHSQPRRKGEQETTEVKEGGRV